MTDLTTKYLGITLKNPLIAASSGLTDHIENIMKLEKYGIAAVVLKSIFEEEIINQEASLLKQAREDKMIYSQLSETLDYIDLHIKDETVSNYLSLIREAKKKTLIPIIASINCITGSEWTAFAKKIEKAGADALELNIFLNPVDESNQDFEAMYLNIAKKTALSVSIPVSVKISKYFTKPGLIIKKISKTGIKGMVLFNRFYTPDVDIDALKVHSAGTISNENDYLDSLRWIGMMSKNVDIDLAASNGIHSAETVIKQILVGASAVQLCSVLYENGEEYIQMMLGEMETWMKKHNFNHIAQFKGKLSVGSLSNAATFERMQFMKYFSGIE